MSSKNTPTIRSSAAEYLTFVVATGDNPQNIEVRYEDEISIFDKEFGFVLSQEWNSL